MYQKLSIFADNISKIILDQEINYDRLANGLQITKDRSQSNKYRNKKILKAQIYLSTGIYSLKEFLQLFEKENLHKQHKIAFLIGKCLQINFYFFIHFNITVNRHSITISTYLQYQV